MKRPELDDESPMPFGKYNGRKLIDVPASYLLFMWSEVLKEQTNSPLGRYIKANLTSLLSSVRKTSSGIREEPTFEFEDEFEPLDEEPMF